MLLTEWNWDDAKEVWQEEARDEGMEEGRTEKKLEIARKMKEKGYSSEEIQAITGVLP